MASAREIWCQGWSEPDAGSDLAGIRSRAVRSDADDGWLLTGQKTWASRGAFAEWCFGLFRTDPEAERHRGLTYFLIEMSTPGVTVRPIPQIDGETGFAELFFEDVFVPDSQVLGGVGRGWNVAMATAGSERGLSLRSPARYTEAAGRLVDLYAERPASDPARAARSADAVAQAWMDAEAYRLNTLWTATRVLDGGSVGPEASANKIHWSETDLAIHRAALALLGPEAEFHGDGSTHPGSTATCSPWPAPSTPAPTRSNATWWPSACSACPGPERGDRQDDDALRLHRPAERVPRRRPPGAGQGVHPRRRARRLRRAVARSPRWTTLADLGVVGVTVPDAHGGLGLGLLDLVLLLEEAGGWPCPSRWPRPPPWRPRCWPSWAGPAVPAIPAVGQQRACDALARRHRRRRRGRRRRAGLRPRTAIAGAVGADLLVLFTAAGHAGTGPTGRSGTGGPEVRSGRVSDRVTVRGPVPRSHPPPGHPRWAPTGRHLLASGSPAARGHPAHRRPGGGGHRAELLGLADTMITLTAGTPRTATSSASPSGASRPSSTCWPAPR